MPALAALPAGIGQVQVQDVLAYVYALQCHHLCMLFTSAAFLAPVMCHCIVCFSLCLCVRACRQQAAAPRLHCWRWKSAYVNTVSSKVLQLNANSRFVICACCQHAVHAAQALMPTFVHCLSWYTSEYSPRYVTALTKPYVGPTYAAGYGCCSN
jgi:hypothetical protein